jgi:hypothetical protein
MPLAPGSPTFYGREDVFQAARRSVDTVARGGILVLTGERRVGKTSVLKHLPLYLDPARYLCVYVDGNGLGIDPGVEGFYLSLIEDLILGLEQAGISMPRVPPEAVGENPQRFFERRFLREVRASIGERTLLLALDEYEELGARASSGTLPVSVFLDLRRLIRGGDRLAFVFAGAHRIEQMAGDHWPALHDLSVYQRIGLLQVDAARRLVVEPVEGDVRYDDPTVHEIARLTAGHPYLTQLCCHLLVDRCNEEGRDHVTVQNVREALDELLDLARAHLTYLWSSLDRGMRLCLAALAGLPAGGDGVPLLAIADRLGDAGPAVESDQVERAITSLIARDLVAVQEGSPTTYSLTAGLYGYWLSRYRPLSRLVEG